MPRRCLLAGVATGLLVESHMGRPTKIEGNREHPGSLGGTDVFAQAATLGLYDPDRSQTVMHDGRISNWASFQAAMGNAKTQFARNGGAGLRILTEMVTSPSLAAQIQGLLKQFPGRSGINMSRAGATMRAKARSWRSASR